MSSVFPNTASYKQPHPDDAIWHRRGTSGSSPCTSTTSSGTARQETPMNPNDSTPPNDQLLVQDCLDVMMAMPNNSIDTVITDPPYPNGQGLFTTQVIDGIIGLYLATKKAKNYVIFFWSPNNKPPRPPPGWWRVATHIWHKPDARSSTPYEHIIVWSRAYNRMQSKVWTIPILDYRSLRDFGTHPTQKPLRLLRNLVELYTNEGDLVLDPFAGTGTTAVACKHARRHYLIIESNPEYATFAQQRLQEREQLTDDATQPTSAAVAEHPTPSPTDERPKPKQRR